MVLRYGDLSESSLEHCCCNDVECCNVMLKLFDGVSYTSEMLHSVIFKGL